METSSNKRIAKNTLFLYIRLLIVMGVSFFTVRVVLQILGIVDYGIHNVVAGIVTMFSFVTMTLSTGLVRFFSFHLGRNDLEMVNKTFNLSLLYFAIIIVVIVAVAETLGLWLLYDKLTIPVDRMDAAWWVFQFSVLTFAVSMLDIPFKSLIMSYEHMNVYAYISIIEVLLKLFVVYALLVMPFDKLATYGALHAFSTLIITSSYVAYCKLKLKGCEFRLHWDTAIFKDLFSFCGWNMIGALSNVLRSQGINILLNTFFNPVVNAARGIAFQINNVVNNFVLNFYSSFRPQITKLYAADRIKEMIDLMFVSSRASYYLIMFLSLPILLEVETILDIWLTEIPEYTVLFARLVIINAMVESLSYPLSASVLSTGRNKWYQIVTGGLLLLNLPVAYLFLRMGFSPQITMQIAIVITTASIVSRLLFVKSYLSVSLWSYTVWVIKPIILVSCASAVIPFAVHYAMEAGLLRLLSVGAVSVLASILCIYTLGITRKERNLCNNIIKKHLTKSATTK